MTSGIRQYSTRTFAPSSSRTTTGGTSATQWQYSGGIILSRLFEPNLPDWRVVLGTAAEVQLVYDDAHAYRLQGGPVISIQYSDIAFATTGEGIGYNFLRGDHYRFGVALADDFGRRERDACANLRGMGNLPAAPVVKLFGSTVLSRKFPWILRGDARQIVGGAYGEFGVTPAQSRASGQPVFDPHAGETAVGVGFSATRFITPTGCCPQQVQRQPRLERR